LEKYRKNKHQDTQGYRRQDVVWGGVDAYNNMKDLNLLITALKCILEKWGKYGEN
jgi:hypothetical protein